MSIGALPILHRGRDSDEQDTSSQCLLYLRLNLFNEDYRAFCLETVSRA